MDHGKTKARLKNRLGRVALKLVECFQRMEKKPVFDEGEPVERLESECQSNETSSLF